MLPDSPNLNPLDPNSHPKPDFIGLEACVPEDNIPTTHIAIVVEGASCSSPDYYPMFVMQSTFVHSALHCSCPHVSWPGVSDFIVICEKS